MTYAHRALCALALAGAQAVTGPVHASDMRLFAEAAADPHLPAVPRTDAERARIAAVTAPTDDFSAPEAFESHPAGAATVRARTTRDAFSQFSATLGFEQELTFKVGDGLFKKIWVAAPSSTRASDGLGPLYNARACQRCHLKDGRGHPISAEDADGSTMFLRISVPDPSGARVERDPLATEIEAHLATLPHPAYGAQMQDHSLPGVPAEYRLEVDWQEIPVALEGGETASLRKPTWRAEGLGYGPLGEGAMLSPRVAPQMIGLGLLEAVPAEDILALADPTDADGDGISGRPNIVHSVEFDRAMLGRFGLKAGAPTIKQQSAAAFAGDIGIANPLFPAVSGECTDQQTICIDAPSGADEGGLEIDAESLDLVAFYSRNLAVPARRGMDAPEVLAGKRVFYETGCTACHNPKFVTARMDDSRKEQSFQLIWPYTDLLLHDMGEGLADHRPEGLATGREWRTPPLWGIGLTKTVSDHTYFLHDGRARNLLEAVLWHGGEAQAARDAVVAMPEGDRAALIAFLESL